ncbi:MAG: FRG domain-containing protein [Tannerella sp.]|nr:FRG domain-containing protein [Tannerella sp.]
MAKCFNNSLLKKDDMTVFYRGVNKVYPVETRHIPSLYYPPNEFYKHEKEIFEEVISVFPEEMLAQKTAVEKLFLMQHYRFPTRLMDMSKNPLIDLFFACFPDKGQQDASKDDGIVYTYTVPTDKIKFSSSHTVSMLSNLCKQHSSFLANDEDDLLRLGMDIMEERYAFEIKWMKEEDFNTVVCIRPRMNNPRIIRQAGYFLLFGVSGEKKNPAKIPNEWIGESISIPAKYKKSILEELNTMDYNEGFFYPDFEHVSNVLRRRYGKIGKC